MYVLDPPFGVESASPVVTQQPGIRKAICKTIKTKQLTAYYMAHHRSRILKSDNRHPDNSIRIRDEPYHYLRGGGGTVCPYPPVSAPFVQVNVPPGLQHLATLDHLFVQQMVEVLELLTGYETDNRYKIYNRAGETVFFALEDSHFCAKCCCGPNRPFKMTIVDATNHPVLYLKRRCGCMCCCFPGCLTLHELSVHSADNQLLGYVKQKPNLCSTLFVLEDPEEQPLLYIKGNCCLLACRSCWCTNIDLKLKSLDQKTTVGVISKHWSGVVKEVFTDADNFGISFPADLDVRVKALIVGACMQIDFMFFETKGNQQATSRITSLW